MATQGTGREMEKKGQELSENFTAMLLTGEKNMAIAAIAWFPDVSSYFLFSIFFSSSALERPQSRRKKLNLSPLRFGFFISPYYYYFAADLDEQ